MLHFSHRSWRSFLFRAF